jgi:hypothetical protein
MTVYVVNKSSHDFSKASQFGDIVYLSQGPINRFACNSMHRKFYAKLISSNEDDYILMCSLGVMNSIACSIFAKLHNKLNLLLYKKGKYIERNLIIDKGENYGTTPIN